MKRVVTYVGVGALLLTTGAFAVAQQPGPQHGGAQPPAAATPKPDASGQDHDAQHVQHMEMCRQMMGQSGMMGGGMGAGMRGGMMMGQGMMGDGGMTGMMPMMGGDSKQQVEMMAMRGEMMKAMGEIMLKYAQKLQPPK
jgi:hypothetical protein